MKIANDINQLNKDSFYSKSLPPKFDYEKLSPYFEFQQHDVIQNTLRHVKMSSILRIDPEAYNDKKAEALKKVPLKSCN
jgi:hypothetical protein